MTRSGNIERVTTETKISVDLDLDGGVVTVSTGVPFFDHMLEQLGRHARIGLQIEAEGDLDIDAHHTVEDVGIALGEALVQALGDKAGIRRYGHALVPMEEALVEAALDISGRPLLIYKADVPAEMIGQFETGLTEDFLQALIRAAGLTLHIELRYARDAHHAVEAIFKALARALGDAVSIDPRSPGTIPSTKGTL